MVTIELKSIGIMDEDLIIDLPMKVTLDIHLNALDQMCSLAEVCVEAGPEINQEELIKTIKRLWKEDMKFRRRLIYRARYESTPTRAEEAGQESINVVECLRHGCVDRTTFANILHNAPQPEEGPMAERKVG